MEKLVGKTLNRYQLVKLLGEGGMGAVFKGFDVTLQRDVAIKIMHPHFASQPNFQERFLQEARTAAQIDHNGVVKVYDFGHAQSQLFIVMEFIPGANLGQMLRILKKEKKWIVLKEGLQIIQLVALALDHAHKRGVLHRDIKPDNIMLKPVAVEGLPYTPVVTDLGLAKLASGGIVTQEGTSMGTPAYMSPEQALGEDTDARSDVYSLGVLLFELACGRLPFPASTLSEAIKYHVKETPPAPRSIRADLSPQLEAVILKTMEKEPNKRYKDAAELADALKVVIASGGVEEKVVDKAAFQATTVEGVESVVSLVTKYQDSLEEQRGASILEEFEKPAEISESVIQVMQTGAPMRNFNIKEGGMIIGRSSSNDITINDQQASRQHAKVEFRDGNYYLTDLNSTNGTYLANTRLLPGIAELWTPDKPLRIGSTWFRLLLAEKTSRVPQGSVARSFAVRTTGTVVDPNMVRSSAGQGMVGVFMENQNLTVEPGSSASSTIVMLNQGAVVDHFNIIVSGIPQNWLSSKPRSIQLMPGDQQEVTLVFQVPRSAESRAGRYALNIRVSSQSAPDQVVDIKASITVGTFSTFTSDFHPKKISTKQTARLSIQNKGNSRELFTVNLRDRADELVFRPAVLQVAVPENQTTTTPFQALARKRRLIGTAQTHSFSAEVTNSKGESQSITGEAVSKAIFPPWLLTLLIGLLIILCLVGVFGGNAWIQSNKHSTQTVVAFIAALTETGVSDMSNAIEGTREAGRTSTQQAQEAFQTATSIAQTAIAEGDDDGDGLSNNDEKTSGTDPNKSDTDGDGLTDGEEVNIFGTNPKNNDTDGDTLLDGHEVNVLKTSPKLADTDSDGTNDNVDPDPGHPPTITPTFTNTSPPTDTPTPINTPVPGTVEDFTGTWANIAENPVGLITLYIDKVNDSLVSFHAYEKCDPQNCDWSAETGGDVYVPFTPPKLSGTYNWGWKSITITVERFGDKLLVETLDNSNQRKNYAFERFYFLLYPVYQIPYEVIQQPTETP